MNIKVYSNDGSSSQDKDFAIPQLEEGKGQQALRDVLIAIQANRRQGNACTKTRAEVRGSGRKIYRQKGTGNARHGDRQAPIFVGGGVVFGPRPRDYSKKVNRKIRLLALNRALLDAATEGSLKVIQSFEFSAPKTKDFANILKNIGIGGKVVIVDDRYDANTQLSARNIYGVEIVEADSINPLDIVNAKAVLMTESALNKVITRLSAKEVSHAAA